MAVYTPQNEIPVPLSMDEIEYLKRRLGGGAVFAGDFLLVEIIQTKLEEALAEAERR